MVKPFKPAISQNRNSKTMLYANSLLIFARKQQNISNINTYLLSNLKLRFMPSLFQCDQCQLKAWNSKPSEGGKMISSHVLIRGTICPNCGNDLHTGAKGDEE